VMACTGFLATGDDGPLFATNEDNNVLGPRIRFVPGRNGGYGAVYFGFAMAFPHAGMNEAGLAFDGFAASRQVVKSVDREPFFIPRVIQAMTECATIDEVLEFMARNDLAGPAKNMVMFADATGDSVIIEPDRIIRKSGAFQVISSFYQSVDPTGANAYGKGRVCTRFKFANDMLKDAKVVNISDARKILSAVHMERPGPTMYSTIFDLDDRLVYVYNFHDFESAAVVDLAKELKKGSQVVDLRSLFERNIYANQEYVYQQRMAAARRREQRASVELPVEILQRYAGKYRAPLGVVEVTVEDGALVLVGPGLPKIKGTPASETEFYVVSAYSDLDATFRLGEDGTIEGAVIRVSSAGEFRGEEFLPRVD